jgi:hypothetical protein
MPKREDEFWIRQKELKAQERLQNERRPNVKEEYKEKIKEQENEYTGQDLVSSSKSKAWFGNEYFDEKTRKWKKPRIKTRTKIASAVALILIIAIIVFILLYIFIWAKQAS